MKNKGPEYSDNSWIWWSVGAILATALITIIIVGNVTGNWPWDRNGGAPEMTAPTQTQETADTTVPEETTEPLDTTAPEETTVPEDSEEATTAPTNPSGTEPTQPKPTQPKPTQPQETEPEETEPEETEPTTQPTQPEEDEDEGGGEKPQPGDIDVPIGPRP